MTSGGPAFVVRSVVCSNGWHRLPRAKQTQPCSTCGVSRASDVEERQHALQKLLPVCLGKCFKHHQTGVVYRVLQVALDVDTLEPLLFYVAETGPAKGSLWARKFDEFFGPSDPNELNSPPRFAEIEA